jgi:hypothetical protein
MVKTFTRLVAFGRRVQLRVELSFGVRRIIQRHASSDRRSFHRCDTLAFT